MWYRLVLFQPEVLVRSCSSVSSGEFSKPLKIVPGLRGPERPSTGLRDSAPIRVQGEEATGFSYINALKLTLQAFLSINLNSIMFNYRVHAPKMD